jgi:hypothetical protein
MDELKLTGNHLKGSRPVLSFSSEFDQLPHLQVTKELLIQVGPVSDPFIWISCIFSHLGILLKSVCCCNSVERGEGYSKNSLFDALFRHLGTLYLGLACAPLRAMMSC